VRNRIAYNVVAILVLLVAVRSPMSTARAHPEDRFEAKAQAMASRSPGASRTTADPAPGQIPLRFEANRGQFDDEVRFAVRARAGTFFFARQEIAAVLQRPSPGGRTETAVPGGASDPMGSPDPEARATGTEPQYLALRVRFDGASAAAAIEGQEAQPGKVNYILGDDPAGWLREVPTYGSILYRDLYPGTDLRYYGAGGRLKYDFVLRPGADVERIALGFGGADGLRVNAGGQLEILTPWGALIEEAPVAWQQGPGGAREAVDARFTILTGGQVGFEVGFYDPSRSLVIDPTLRYSTYVGGNDKELSHAMALDSAGNVMFTASTMSPDFPTTAGALDSTYAGDKDIYIAKLSADGRSLLFSTFVGGSADEDSYALALDAAGTALITGYTRSEDFPTTGDAFDSTYNGDPNDIVILKLASDGSSLLYSTYAGGNGEDVGFTALWDGGEAVIGGHTTSTNFPTTPGAYDTGINGSKDAYLLKLAASGQSLVFGTYLGGNQDDLARSIAQDTDGSYVVAGYTYSDDFPTTPGVFDGTHNGDRDVFVSRLSSSGAALLQSTVVGGSAEDGPQSVALDPSGRPVVAGYTASPGFPSTSGSHQGGNDMFVLKLAKNLSSLSYSALLGGSKSDQARGVALDNDGNAIVAGDSASSDFPTTADAEDRTHNGSYDAVVAKVAGDSGVLLYSTFIGGSAQEQGNALALWGGTDAIVFGHTESSNFPTTPGAYDTNYNGARDAIVFRLDGIGGGAVPCYDLETDVDPAGSGWVSRKPAPNCPNDPDKYASGTAVELEAVPYADWTFSHWSGSLSGTNNPKTITMNGNSSVTAHFAAPTCYTVSISVDPVGGGSVETSPQPNCGGDEYREGTQVTLSAVPASGYRFLDWSGDVGGSANPTTISVDGDMTVRARFEETSAYTAYLPTVRRYVSAPTLHPIENADGDGSYGVSWTAVSGAEAYVLQEATDSSFTSPKLVYEGPGHQFAVSDQGPTRYFYRVKARTASGSSSWSDVQSVDVRWEKEDNDTAPTANGPLVSGLAYHGYPDDQKDYYRIQLAARHRIRIELTDHTGQGVQLLLYYQSTDNLVDRDYDPPYQVDHEGQAGRYYIYIFSESGHNHSQPYTLKAVYE
jgi:hypothetical protein